MNIPNRAAVCSLVATALLIALAPTRTAAQGAPFSYQGRLLDSGQPANGSYDLQFRLTDSLANGSQIGAALTNRPVPVVNGLFTVALDFGVGAFDGSARYLEIGVRTNGNSGAYSLLSPRQPITLAPYAAFASSAGIASNLVPGASVTLNGAGITNLNGGSIGQGTVSGAALDAPTWSAITNRVMTNLTLYGAGSNAPGLVLPPGHPIIVEGTNENRDPDFDYGKIIIGVANGKTNVPGGSIAVPDRFQLFDRLGDGLWLWSNHGGTNHGLAILQGFPDVDVLPGDLGSFQMGKSEPAHEYIHLQYDDQPNPSSSLGHSKVLYFSGRTMVSNSTPILAFGVEGVCVDSNSASMELRFFSQAPFWKSAGQHPPEIPGYWVGSFLTNGFQFRGKLVQERAIGTIGAQCPLDFASAQCLDLTAATTNVTFFTTNETGFATNFEERTFILRTGPLTVQWHWPNGWFRRTALPANSGAGELVYLTLKSVGPGETNKFAAAETNVDNTFSWDSNALAFFAATNANIQDPVQQGAINSLVQDAKAHGWWTNCDLIYVFPPNNSNGCSINLKDPSKYRITWHGPMVFDANGVTGNGSNAYGDTGFGLGANGVAYRRTSAHLFAYCGTIVPTEAGRFIEGSQFNGSTIRAGLYRSGSNIASDGLNNGDTLVGIAGLSSDFRGPLAAIRVDVGYGGTGARTAFNVGAVSAPLGLPNVTVGILCRNTDQGADHFSNANLRGATVGGGLSEDDWDTFRVDWDNFENALGRKAP